MVSRPPDAIVVLGAQVFRSGMPSPSLQRRVEHAVSVWEKTPEAAFVASGGLGDAPISEAEAMRRMAIDSGVPDTQIVLEDRSTSTLEHAAFVGPIARSRGWERLLIVTDGYHLPRAKFLFRRLGLSISGDPVRGRGDGSRRRWIAGVIREIPAWGKNFALLMIGRYRTLENGS